ncbi:MAG: ribosome silencing factor [Armatimonadetes bacterium]|nr:ribosome silencing factor [Armatimonadota bacterium]
MQKKKWPSEQKTELIVSVLEEKKAIDPVVIDVRQRTLMADSFIIASGTSKIHIRSLADAIVEKMADNGMKNKRVAGYEDGSWVLLDYGDVVVHIMSPEQREFYRLEAYWTGAEKGSPPPLSPEELE